MKPFDPRLWKHSQPVRGYLLLTVALGLVTALSVIVSGVALGTVLAGVITDPQRRTVADWAGWITVFGVAMLVRTAAVWLHARYAQRSASRVVAQLKDDVLRAATNQDPRDQAANRDAVATVVTRGLDNLAPYLTGYLPSLALAAVVPPTVLVVIFLHDVTAALIVFFTLPLIPVFMVLIGLLTRGRAQAKLSAMTRQSAQLLDLIAGLPTLRALGREKQQTQRVRELGESFRASAMGALRYAFLSSMVLELLATLCVALVAVSIGLRLVYGDMELQAGLVALILAPEVYLPLRTVGAQFHAAEDGAAAVGRIATLLETPARARQQGSGVVVGSVRGQLHFDGLSVSTRGGDAPHRLTAVARPGAITVLTGPNGAGKSTALLALLNLCPVRQGQVRLDGVDVRESDPEAVWAQVAWLPQRPALVSGTVRENLELTGRANAGEMGEAATATGFDEVLAALPHGLSTVLGTGGVGLSLGQRQRLALTRVLSSDAPIVLLDEPTAHLDAAAEQRVLAAVRGLADAGRTVVMVGHRQPLLDVADLVVEVRAAGELPVVEENPPWGD